MERATSEVGLLVCDDDEHNFALFDVLFQSAHIEQVVLSAQQSKCAHRSVMVGINGGVTRTRSTGARERVTTHRFGRA